jgi:acyl-CoA synthetase (AMP-forming)/AMP-acid ligase II
LREEVDIDDSANFSHYAEKDTAPQNAQRNVELMKTDSMQFFELLRQHARQEPNAIASRSSRRTVTYRKFWSRIERASARLIGEWRVQPGDLVVYWGCGHQDALMLYIAVARCGARLLPLEHPQQRQYGSDYLQQHRAKVLLHDDELSPATLPAADTVTDLSSLIATRCHHHPDLVEDDTRPSLLELSRTMDGKALCTERSLANLRTMAGDASSPFAVSQALFDLDVLAAHVLPALAARGTIVFR